MEYFREKAVIYIIILPITIHVASKVITYTLLESEIKDRYKWFYVQYR